MIKEEINRKSEVLHALGHPIRFAIVKGLLKNGCHVNKIVNALGIPQSSVSQHLGVLKAARIIAGERNGVSICYKVIDEYARKIIQI